MHPDLMSHLTSLISQLYSFHPWLFNAVVWGRRYTQYLMAEVNGIKILFTYLTEARKQSERGERAGFSVSP